MKTEEGIRTLTADGILPNDPVFLEIFRTACALPDSYLAVVAPVERRIDFITSYVKAMTGHSAEQFMKGGLEFLVSITTAESMPIVLQEMSKYVNMAKTPGFNTQSIFVHEYPCTILSADRKKIDLISLGVGLKYTSHADLATGIAIIVPLDSPQYKAARNFLRSLKARHNEISRPDSITSAKEPLKKVFLLGKENPTITRREKEVLKLLADGLTSGQIAGKLNVEETTVETHRRNLIKKFDARNIAELIKKASKIYWLE